MKYYTYKKAIPQCLLLSSIRTPISTCPIRVIVGAIVSGPTNLNRIPIIPEQPKITWVIDATIRLPWICKCNNNTENDMSTIESHHYQMFPDLL